MSPRPIRRVVSNGKKISKSGLVQGRTTCTRYNRYFCLPNDLYLQGKALRTELNHLYNYDFSIQILKGQNRIVQNFINSIFIR